jgi:hypothetical protein
MINVEGHICKKTSIQQRSLKTLCICGKTFYWVKSYSRTQFERKVIEAGLPSLVGYIWMAASVYSDASIMFTKFTLTFLFVSIVGILWSSLYLLRETILFSHTIIICSSSNEYVVFHLIKWWHVTRKIIDPCIYVRPINEYADRYWIATLVSSTTSWDIHLDLSRDNVISVAQTVGIPMNRIVVSDVTEWK